jgi:membrane-bound lytic murein transglycosylase D
MGRPRKVHRVVSEQRGAGWPPETPWAAFSFREHAADDLRVGTRRRVVKKILLTSVALAVAACSHAPAPAVSPTPVRANDSTAARVATILQAFEDTTKPSAAPTAPNDSARVSATDVSRRAVEVFGDSASPVKPTPNADSAATDDGPSWDIDVHSYETTERVEHYVRIFSGSARERIAAQLEEGSRYEPMIRAKMRAGGLPEDMYYLALIESGFDPNAYSRAAAVGMWQFMASTGRDMGLRVDWWVDERRDPVKSTTAAVGFIKGLKEQLGSLYLAAAAYNGGPGRIARGLTRYADDLEGTTGDDRFFALADKDFLPRETREYVPQLIAAALIAKEPERYGMQMRALPPFAYDSVRVGPATPLAALAAATGSTVEQIQELNPQILRGMTPPRDSLRVRIPAGSAASFDSLFAALPSTERVGIKRVLSKKGDYPETIAGRYGLRVHQIMLFNPKMERSRKTGRVAAGQVIIVPTRAVAAAATDAPDPSIERYAGSTHTHVVKRGESLGLIAKRYHTTVKSIMALNGLKRSIIFPGQSLVVSGRARHKSSRRGSARPSAARAKAKSGVAQAGSPRSPR